MKYSKNIAGKKRTGGKPEGKTVRNMRRFFLCLPFAFLCGCASADRIPPMPEDALLLDVRTASEYHAGHLSGAVLLPHDRVEGMVRIVVPDRNTPVYLYCRSGRRSALAEETMKRLGYAEVYNLGSLDEARKFLDRPLVR